MLLNCECDSITRRTVVLLIAGFQFIHGLGSFLVALFNSKNLKSEEFSAIIVSSILTMMFAAVLVLGVLLKRPGLLWVWLGWSSIFLIYYVILLLVVIFFVRKFQAVLLFYGITIFLQCFFLYVVWNHYRDMVKDKEDCKSDSDSRPTTVSTVLNTKLNQVSAKDKTESTPVQSA